MTTCPRLFEVEALRDGRLGGTARSAFERHLASCEACARELAAFERLAAALRDGHTQNTDELHARRERTRLLAAFDRALTGQRAQGVPRLSRRVLSGLVAATAVCGTALWLGTRPDAPALPPSAIAIRPTTGARWSRSATAARDRIVLDEGRLWIQVRRADSELPLLVVLPDGELEDVGTTFTITVESGRTTQVAVEEGSVILRLRGQAPRTIGAQGSWATPAAERAPAPVPTGDPIVKAQTPVPPARPTVTAHAPAPRPSEPAEPPARRAASEAFREAMSALSRGDGRVAAARFSRFLEAYPSDPRAEDAAYLRVLAHQRSGDAGGLQRAAREYLARYPAGFRRREVEALLSPVP